MGKPASPAVRQRKGERSNLNGDDEDDDDILEFASASQRSERRWIILIVVLVLTNFVLGYFHMQKRSRREEMQESSIVKALTDESLPSHVAGHPNGTLVYFHVPDCAHCQKLAPEFETAARELQSICDTSLVTANAALTPLAAKRYAVTKFPTLLWFRRGELVKDVSPAVRTAAKIVEFVDQSLQVAVIDFASHVEFDEAVPQLRSVLQNESIPVVVGFGGPGVYKVLVQAAEKFRGITAFLFVKEPREGDPHIRGYARLPENDKDYNGALTIQDVQSWLQPFMKKRVSD